MTSFRGSILGRVCRFFAFKPVHMSTSVRGRGRHTNRRRPTHWTSTVLDESERALGGFIEVAAHTDSPPGLGGGGLRLLETGKRGSTLVMI